MPPSILSDYTAILVDHEQDYRLSQGLDRQKIVADIVKEIAAESNGALTKDVLNGLDKVSQLFNACKIESLST